MRESIFDWFLSRSRILEGADSILFLKPAFPRTVQRASRLQIPTFVWASILHPRFNQKAVLDERRAWQLEGGEAYTDEERIERLSRFFRTVDHILVGSELAQRSFVSHRRDREAPILLRGTFTVDCDRFQPVKSAVSRGHPTVPPPPPHACTKQGGGDLEYGAPAQQLPVDAPQKDGKEV